MANVHSAVKAIIRDGEKILVVKQKVGELIFWDLPGGKVDFGESPYDTLHREVKEETQLEVDIEKPLGMFWFFREKDGNQVICNTFLCTPKHMNVDLDNNPVEEGITDFQWVTKDEFLRDTYQVSHPSLKQLIEKL